MNKYINGLWKSAAVAWALGLSVPAAAQGPEQAPEEQKTGVVDAKTAMGKGKGKAAVKVNTTASSGDEDVAAPAATQTKKQAAPKSDLPTMAADEQMPPPAPPAPLLSPPPAPPVVAAPAPPPPPAYAPSPAPPKPTAVDSEFWITAPFLGARGANVEITPGIGAEWRAWKLAGGHMDDAWIIGAHTTEFGPALEETHIDYDGRKHTNVAADFYFGNKLTYRVVDTDRLAVNAGALVAVDSGALSSPVRYVVAAPTVGVEANIGLNLGVDLIVLPPGVDRKEKTPEGIVDIKGPKEPTFIFQLRVGLDYN